MSGHLAVVGLGPGDARYLTPEADEALAGAQALYGYGPYLDRVPVRAGQIRSASDNREERSRAAAALRHAAEGTRVAVVSGGDPGVFAMAAAVCEAIESGPESWRALDVAIVPGITAMLAVAARGLVVVVAVLLVTDPFAGDGKSTGGVADNASATSLTTVRRQSLSQQTQVSGTLGYAGSSSIRVPSGTAPTAVTQTRQQLARAEAMLATARAGTPFTT